MNINFVNITDLPFKNTETILFRRGNNDRISLSTKSSGKLRNPCSMVEYNLVVYFDNIYCVASEEIRLQILITVI